MAEERKVASVKVIPIRTTRHAAFAIIFLLSITSLLPIILIGYHQGADLPHHLQYADTIRDSMLEGDPFPSWGEGENLGYGGLRSRFYPPAMATLNAVFLLATGSWHLSVWLSLLAVSIVGGFGAYLLTREFSSENAGLVAGSVFVFSPYFLADIYARSFYAEFAGIAVLAFPLVFATRLIRRNKWSDCFWLAVTSSLLVLTHLPLSLIALYAFPVYLLALPGSQRTIRASGKFVAAALMTLGATAFFWIPVLYELDWFRHTKLIPGVNFDYEQHFLLVPPGEVVFGLWFNNLILFALASLVVAAAFGFYLSGRKCNSGENKQITGTHGLIRRIWREFFAADNARGSTARLRGVFTLFLFSLLMTTPLSYPLWAVLPAIEEVQFPWRWLSVASIASAVLFGAGSSGLMSYLRSRGTRLSWPLAAALLAVLLAASCLYKLLFKLDQDYIPAQTFSSWAQVQVESLGHESYWTIWAREEAFTTDGQASAGDRDIVIRRWAREERTILVGAGDTRSLRIATLYYPHWKARSDYGALEVKSDKFGVIEVQIPKEKIEVDLYFDEPVYALSAGWISAVVWPLMFAGLLVAGLVGRREVEETDDG